MSRHSETLPGQYEDEETEISVTPEILGKGKQPENRAETAANKHSDKGFDFSHHPVLAEGSEEIRPASLKIGDLREFKRVIRDITEGEKWNRLLSAIAEHDQAFLSQHYLVQRKASECRKQSKKLATELQNAEENWTHDRIELENAKDRITELQNQLEESHRQRREATASSTAPEAVGRNYRPIGINPSEPLKGTDPNEYNTWAYAIKEKLETDEPLYPNDKRKVRYALSQMKDPIFDVMHSWVFDVGEELTLKLFFKEIENYMGIHHQKKDAKKELLTVKMNKTESVSEYYHRLFKL